MGDVNKRFVTPDEFYSMINQNKMSDIVLDNREIGKNSVYTFEKLQVQNVSFVDCFFDSASFRFCEFHSCQFIRCHFFDLNIYMNRFIGCHFDNVTFYNNLNVTHNVFERVTGEIKYFHACQFDYNTFMDMDFTGFLPFYITVNNSITLSNTRFINTTVSLEGLKKMCICKDVHSEKHKSIKHRYILGTYTELNPETLEYTLIESENPFKNKLPQVKEIVGCVDDRITLNLTNLSEEARLNVIASIFTKCHYSDSITAPDMQGTSNKSFLEYYTLPNPNPIRIVDDRGYILNDGVVQDISFKINGFRSDYNLDLNELITISYGPQNNLLNPDNYSCRSLIRLPIDDTRR